MRTLMSSMVWQNQTLIELSERRQPPSSATPMTARSPWSHAIDSNRSPEVRGCTEGTNASSTTGKEFFSTLDLISADGITKCREIEVNMYEGRHLPNDDTGTSVCKWPLHVPCPPSPETRQRHASQQPGPMMASKRGFVAQSETCPVWCRCLVVSITCLEPRGLPKRSKTTKRTWLARSSALAW